MRRGRIVLVALLLLAVAGVAVWRFWPGLDDRFVAAFRDGMRGNDDRVAAMQFDEGSRLLAIGRESGTVELWDAAHAGKRTIIQAHSYRADKLCIGDGIVFSGSGLESTTKVWDARTGALKHQLPGVRGPVARSPLPNLYLVATNAGLMLFDAAAGALVGPPLAIEGEVTSLTADAASSRIALGTASGTLELIELRRGTDGAPRLVRIARVQPYQPRNWVQAVSLLDDGRRLISVVREGEIAEWDPASLTRRRVFPRTLQHVHQAAFVPGRPWLAISGTLDPQGMRSGKVEVVDLMAGVATRYKANTNLPVSVLLPALSVGLIAQSGSAKAIRFPGTDEHAPFTPGP